MAGKFQRKCFSEINLDDPFFDSLKADYPGTANSTGFITWFRKKASSGKTALVFEDELGIGAFINLKPDEAEEIHLPVRILKLVRREEPDGPVLPVKPGYPLHLPLPEPHDALGDPASRRLLDLFLRDLS